MVHRSHETSRACRWLRRAAGFVALVAVAGCTRETTAPTGARHVVVISLDTTRPDHFGFMGSPDVSTPALDALARESIVFEDYMTVVPTTLASHTSLFTGKYPHHHGTARNGFMVNRDNVMLAEILHDAGFRTAGFAGSFALESRFDFPQGFDHYDESFTILVGDDGADQNQRRAEQVTDAAMQYLDDAGVPDRLFLFVHYFDPHRPYAAPAPYDTLYDPHGGEPLPSPEALSDDATLSQEEKIAGARRWEQRYAAEITYMDHHVGRLLDDLRRRGVLDNALLILTSDHGENLRDHPVHFAHGRMLFQSTVAGVCVVRLPGGEGGGSRVAGVIASIDILPTITALLGIETTAGVDGEPVDLRQIGGSLAPRTRFAQATMPWQGVESDPRWTNMLKAQCIRDGRYKLVWTPYNGTEALYDLMADPGELHNLLDEPSSETTALAERLRATLEQWRDSAQPLPSHFERSQQEDTIKRLRSLGYIK